MTDSFLSPVQDVLPFRRRHAPPLQFGIGSASHAAERRPRFSADYLATRPMRSPVNLPRHRSGPDGFRSISPSIRASIPKATVLYHNSDPRALPPRHLLQYVTGLVFEGGHCGIALPTMSAAVKRAGHEPCSRHADGHHRTHRGYVRGGLELAAKRGREATSPSRG